MAEEKSKLITLIEKYEELRACKEELAEATKDINEELKKVQEEMVEQMVEEDVPSQGYGSYNYFPQTVRHYSFKSEELLSAEGKDKMAVMRENGYGFLIKESIAQRSLETVMKEAAESEEGIPEEVESILHTYEELKIVRRKSRKGALASAREAVAKTKGTLEG